VADPELSKGGGWVDERQCISRDELGRLAAGHLPGGPVGPPAWRVSE